MLAFSHTESSCYADSVIVAAFTTMTALDWVWTTPNPAAVALQQAVATLRGGTGGTLNKLRKSLGAPWNTNAPQSAVDFFNALLREVGVNQLGTWYVDTYLVREIPMVSPLPVHSHAMPVHTVLSAWRSDQDEMQLGEVDTFTVHSAMAGVHHSTGDVLNVHVEWLPSEAEHAVKVVVPTLVSAPALVVEVGRGGTPVGCTIHYGVMDAVHTVTLQVRKTQYRLMGVVCRTQGHFVAFVWALTGWYYYDDMHGKFQECANPEQHKHAPSLFGELFFYQIL